MGYTTIIPQTSIDDPALNLRLFKMMQVIRRSQEILQEEYHPADEMRCPMHFCIGQEAAPTALSELLRPSDVLYSHHRNHGYYLSRKAPLVDMMGEFYGKATGANSGYSGSQELSHPDYNFYSGAILSGAFVLAVGSAFAAKYSGTDDIAVGVLGDGGMEEGVVFESLNLAAVKKLPVLFLCENNGYSIQSPLKERTGLKQISDRVKAFGVETTKVDGNDVYALCEVLNELIPRMRNDPAPHFLEVMTYRTCAHVGPEDDDHYGYREQSEIDEWRARDPLLKVRKALQKDGVKKPEIEAITHDIDSQIWTAINAAKAAPFPKFEDALSCNISDEYASFINHLIEDKVGDFDPTQPETRPGPF
jgi:TPP-dependent pyruvate/acetoin dehydrogenase alpha subunit